MEDPPVCLVLPPGLQCLLTAVGLVRVLSSEQSVLVATERRFLNVIGRLFHGARVTFWFDEPNPVARARSIGLDVLVLPHDPKSMYCAAGVPVSAMHAEFAVAMPDTMSPAIKGALDAAGPTFVVTWGTGVRRKLLPYGIPVLDASTLEVDDPLEYCDLLQRAMQVHAPDGWFLTLADLLGGNSRKFCHAYAGPLSALACRRKYRKRVAVVCHGKKCHMI